MQSSTTDSCPVAIDQFLTTSKFVSYIPDCPYMCVIWILF